MRRRMVRLALAAVCACTAAACGSGSGSSFDVGLQKVALDLAFKDETALPGPAKPVTAEQAFEPLPVESEAALTINYPNLARRDIRPPLNIPDLFRVDCPAPPPNSAPAETVSRGISTLVKPGRYMYRDKGTFDIEGPITLKGDLPPYSVRDYVDAHMQPQPNDIFGQPVPDYYDWSLVEPIGTNDYVQRDFQATPTALQLVKLTYKLGDNTYDFKPYPAITMMDLGANGGEGASWDSGGTDTRNGTSMTVHGTIVRRELVNGCGKVFEAYRVQSTERIVSLAGTTPFSSQTSDANDLYGINGTHSPNVYWVAPQYGGMFLAEETHTTTTVGAFILTIDGLSTIMNLDAKPVPDRR